jgi:4-amino-4-deoxy-L-arabinose transferase-like glycosyltransferase
MPAIVGDATETNRQFARPALIAQREYDWRRNVWPLSIGVAIALAARLLAAYRLSVGNPDTPVYDELGRNWLRFGTYGLFQGGVLVPSDFRPPGYPLFLALVHRIFGESLRTLTTVQALLDALTCIACAIVATLIPRRGRDTRAGVVALWLAAVSAPMIAASATALTETLSGFLTILALLALALVIDPESEGTPLRFPTPGLLAVGVLIGLGMLVRSEAGLLLPAAFVGLFLRFRRTWTWRRLSLAAALTILGMALPVTPWLARNWRLTGRPELQGARPLPTSDKGYILWLHTWFWRDDDDGKFLWGPNVEHPLRLDQLPPEAFDSSQERAQVGQLLNLASGDPQDAGPQVQKAFADLALRRTERRPLRTLITVPLKRAGYEWINQGIRSRHIFPAHPGLDSAVNLLGIMAPLILSYVLAIAGACLSWRSPVAAALIAYLILRTGFTTVLDVPAHRYMFVLLPLAYALAGATVAAFPGIAWRRPASLEDAT